MLYQVPSKVHFPTLHHLERLPSESLPLFNSSIDLIENGSLWLVVVVQLVEHLLPTHEICASNPIIGKIYMYYQVY